MGDSEINNIETIPKGNDYASQANNPNLNAKHDQQRFISGYNNGGLDPKFEQYSTNFDSRGPKPSYKQPPPQQKVNRFDNPPPRKDLNFQDSARAADSLSWLDDMDSNQQSRQKFVSFVDERPEGKRNKGQMPPPPSNFDTSDLLRDLDRVPFKRDERKSELLQNIDMELAKLQSRDKQLYTEDSDYSEYQSSSSSMRIPQNSLRYDDKLSTSKIRQQPAFSERPTGGFDRQRILDLEGKLDEKEVIILQLQERLESEQSKRRLYEEGKDELIYDLEQKVDRQIDDLATERSKKDVFRQQLEQLSEEVESWKRQSEMLRNEVEMWKSELQNEKILAAQQKENHSQELEQLKQASNGNLERERKGWSTIAQEKENVIETMRKQYDEALQEIGRQKARWEDFESKKRELMSEFETQIINAARALEEERHMRKEHEKTLDILTKTSIDSNQKAIRLESELSRQQQNIQQLQNENRNLVETLNNEKQSFNEERKILRDRIDAKHKELMNALKNAEEDDEKRNLHQTNENLHNQLDALKMEFNRTVEEKRVLEAERNAEKDLRERLHASFEERTIRMEEMQRAQLEDMKEQLSSLLNKTSQLESERNQEIMNLNYELKMQREKQSTDDTGRLMHKIKELSQQNLKLKQDLEAAQQPRKPATSSTPGPAQRTQQPKPQAASKAENDELKLQIQHMSHQLDNLSKKLNQSMSRPKTPSEAPNKSVNQSQRKAEATLDETKLNRSREQSNELQHQLRVLQRENDAALKKLNTSASKPPLDPRYAPAEDSEEELEEDELSQDEEQASQQVNQNEYNAQYEALIRKYAPVLQQSHVSNQQRQPPPNPYPQAQQQRVPPNVYPQQAYPAKPTNYPGQPQPYYPPPANPAYYNYPPQPNYYQPQEVPNYAPKPAGSSPPRKPLAPTHTASEALPNNTSGTYNNAFDEYLEGSPNKLMDILQQVRTSRLHIPEGKLNARPKEERSSSRGKQRPNASPNVSWVKTQTATVAQAPKLSVSTKKTTTNKLLSTSKVAPKQRTTTKR